MADLAALTAAVEAGNRTGAAEQTKAALDDGLDPRTILAAMTDAMDVVGRKFQEGELFVPEMPIAPPTTQMPTGTRGAPEATAMRAAPRRPRSSSAGPLLMRPSGNRPTA